MKCRVSKIFWLAALGVPAGCAGAPAAPMTMDDAANASPGAEAPSNATVAAEPAPSTFEEQVALGQKLYGERCAGCHGASGEGGKGPRLVGLDEGALPLEPRADAKYRKGTFRTVADVAAFVTQNMPPGKGGALTGEEYWSVLAFDLKANGIELDKKLDGALAGTLEIPR